MSGTLAGRGAMSCGGVPNTVARSAAAAGSRGAGVAAGGGAAGDKSSATAAAQSSAATATHKWCGALARAAAVAGLCFTRQDLVRRGGSGAGRRVGGPAARRKVSWPRRRLDAVADPRRYQFLATPARPGLRAAATADASMPAQHVSSVASNRDPMFSGGAPRAAVRQSCMAGDGRRAPACAHRLLWGRAGALQTSRATRSWRQHGSTLAVSRRAIWRCGYLPMHVRS